MSYSTNKPTLSWIQSACLCLLFSLFCTHGYAKAPSDIYLIATGQEIKTDKAWMAVVNQLQQNHPGAKVVYYRTLTDLLPHLKSVRPRYLCVVEKPEHIDKNFVIEGNRMCRQIDDDIYDDYVWGIVTGHTADDALRIAKQSARPFVIKTALSTTSEVKSAVWFDRFAAISDGNKNEWYEKTSPTDSVHTHKMDKQFRSLGIFMDKWKEIDPDIILSSSHATESNLEMPFSSGNLRPNDGKLYADMFVSQAVPPTMKPRVYMPIGNCLIANMNATNQSMAAAWLSSGGATAMLGYVVTTWFGRNGWGALKFLLSAPQQHTLAEAAYLNRQDMYTHEQRRNPAFHNVKADFEKLNENDAFSDIEMQLSKITGKKAEKEDAGYAYDRDVVIYYGDPAWDVRVQANPNWADYTLDLKEKGKQTVVTLRTGPAFSMEKISGKGFKEEHVKDIPLGYFFPHRVKTTKVAQNAANLDVVVNEDFILIYDRTLKPNATYTLVLE